MPRGRAHASQTLCALGAAKGSGCRRGWGRPLKGWFGHHVCLGGRRGRLLTAQVPPLLRPSALLITLRGGACHQGAQGCAQGLLPRWTPHKSG